MGSKLGKMVKLIHLTLILFLGHSHGAIEKDIDINLLTKDLNADALVLSLVGSKDGLRLEKSFVKQPNYNVIAKYKSFNKRDEYVLRILNDEKKEVAVIGLGNPFYIHAQHINYEDSNEFGSYIDNAKFNAVIPIGIDASYVVLASQDAFGFDDINEISLEKSLINNQ
jgi:hypothetical protein